MSARGRSSAAVEATRREVEPVAEEDPADTEPQEVSKSRLQTIMVY